MMVVTCRELPELEAWRHRRRQSEDAFGRAFTLLEGASRWF